MAEEILSREEEQFRRTYLPISKMNGDTTGEEIKLIYDNWASTYEEHQQTIGYIADIKAVNLFSEILDKQNHSKNSHILDVGSGTGKIGQQLHNLGYTNIDALDISIKMLEIAEKKNVYKKLICGGLGEESIDITVDKYDAIIAVGCITLGHVKPRALMEMVDLVKAGGLISFTLRNSIIEVDAYGYNQEIRSLTEKGVWDIISTDTIQYHKPDDALKKYYFITCQKKLY